MKADDLNRKIAAFRAELENPRGDSHVLGQELYHMLMVPALEEDLRQAQAETLMWSLDGTLRYLPLAALSDGKQYLIEKYRLSVFTPASLLVGLKDIPKTGWSLLGMGVTRQYENLRRCPMSPVSWPALCRGRMVRKAFMPGEALLDDDFTRQTMIEQLRHGYPVVHIASHFVFSPGDGTRVVSPDGRWQTSHVERLCGASFLPRRRPADAIGM